MKRFLYLLSLLSSMAVCTACEDDVEIKTSDAYNISATYASVSCEIESDDISLGECKEIGVLYSTSRSTVEDGAGSEATTKDFQGNTYTVALSLSDLICPPQPDTKFYYCGYIYVHNDYYYGNIKSFRTPKN